MIERLSTLDGFLQSNVAIHFTGFRTNRGCQLKRHRMFYLASLILIAVVAFLGWTLVSRTAYESAEYSVIEKDGSFEIRQYPDLMLVTTKTESDLQGNDGSFMRLFGYISGANEKEQKVSMTTPVFMESGEEATGQMGFVIPKQVASSGAPQPSAADVKIRKREGGRFAVIRFSGRLDSKSAEKQEAKLREWIAEKRLECEDEAEQAGYDPPFTPPFLRRNEVLIRLNASKGGIE